MISISSEKMGGWMFHNTARAENFNPRVGGGVGRLAVITADGWCMRCLY